MNPVASGRPRSALCAGLGTATLLVMGLAANPSAWALADSRGAETAGARPVEVVVHSYFRPNDPTDTATQRLIAETRKDPLLRVRQWGGINLPGGWGRASLMMSFAGRTAPDIMLTFFHGIRSDIEQGFLYPLNEWIGDDLNGDGEVEPAEARWPAWARVAPLWRTVATVDGKIYGLPVPFFTYTGLIFRRDLVIAAGLNPDQPPETWDEFFYWCQRLTFPKKDVAGAELKRGQRGLFLTPLCWLWLPWMEAAGDTPIVQVRTSPTTGKEYVFRMDDLQCIAPDTGEALSRVPPRWRANFSSPGGVAACDFFHRLMWAPWLIHPVSGEPVNLTADDLRRGSVEVNGARLTFQPEDVIRGVIRVMAGGGGWQEDLFARGEVAIMQWFDRDMERILGKMGVPPESIGMFPIPAKDRHHRPVIQVQRHYAAMTQMVASRPKAERDKIWKCLLAITGEEAGDADIRRKVLLGNAAWCHPRDLERLGLTDYLREVPAYVRRNFERIDKGEIALSTEPFAGFWEGAGVALQNNVLSLILSVAGETFDHAAALRQVDHECNSGLMFAPPRAVLDRHRPLARVLFGIALTVVLTAVTLIIRERYRTVGSAGSVTARCLPWLMLAPAVLSIGLWSYYPLLRGALMAFQDYRIVGSKRWVGLDNFIAVAMDHNTWLYAGKTLKFVALTMLFGFLTPIGLAFLLTEVPRGKIFYRTLFFLPQMTSGIVVTMMWSMLYNPTENGVLNRLLAVFHLPAQAWLQDPFWAMFCCILPGVWAGAGIGSLIYIAALKSFPEDYYEAAAIDGAGFFGRLRHIALPQLLPLIIINFVGSFIAAFQSMGQIFLLTFGGPGKETTVLSLHIWKLAYNDLRFSTATAMAWFLGTALIAFTYLQIRFLRRVEFRHAEAN